ncbi:hypothetical protein Q31b_10450 [Novipirellula aureliae]|uniref:Uncharacterized protein n=1 Tax=Novipirellula aureliae TaxID=2527966 RepID=A0A5C6EF67_9BACT|nr:hypothetical protein Q31b_10450 [Novipirellula aureliae]
MTHRPEASRGSSKSGNGYRDEIGSRLTPKRLIRRVFLRGFTLTLSL